MDLGIAGRTAIVTGASKGIGRGVAEALVRERCNVAVCARTEDELQEAAEAFSAAAAGGAQVLAVPADLTRDDDREEVVARTLGRFHAVDILVNNAANVSGDGRIHEATLDDWRDVFELNLFAAVDLVRKVLPGMREQGWGRIVNISSENGRQPYPDMLPYSASKGALDNFTKGLSKSCADDGVLVNAVSPAFIMTPLVEGILRRAAEAEGETLETAIDDFLEEDRPHIEVGRPAASTRWPRSWPSSAPRGRPS